MITTGHITVGTVPSLIDGTHNSDFRLTIHNADSTQQVLVGGPDVTVDTGLGIEKLETLQFHMSPLTRLYAISAKTGHIIHWMKQV